MAKKFILHVENVDVELDLKKVFLHATKKSKVNLFLFGILQNE